MDLQAEKYKTERVIELCRRTRQEIAKWNQMTALRFQTRGDIRHPQPPFGGEKQVLGAKITSLQLKKCKLPILFLCH